MAHKNLWIFPFTGGLVLLGISLLLATSGTVDAQCGSQASSCKSCHEVQKELPVNADGTGWHESHAFGDFCIMCHAGNEQATDKIEAHTGMVPPLSDVDTACKMCHADDLPDRVAVYTALLGVEAGSGDDRVTPPFEPTTAANTEPQPAAQPDVNTPVSEAPADSVPADNKIALVDPNVVDYLLRYNEIVLGERPVNVGNIVLVVLIALVVFAGGGFVIVNEVRRSNAAAATKKVSGEYPADVVDMLPAISDLKPGSRQSLRNILKNSRKSDRMLDAIDSLVSEDSPKE